jgi:hypothetical protein
MARLWGSVMSRERRNWIPGSPPAASKGELEVTKPGNARYPKPPVTQASEESLPRPEPPFRTSAYYQSRTPLVPTEKEVAQLPQLARIAFVERCALRVKPVCPAGTVTAADAARVIFETATVDSPLTAQLRCIRRDFVRLKKLARKEKWTDDTPMPPDVFGPMWPDGVEPYWAVEPPPPPAPTPPTPPPKE